MVQRTRDGARWLTLLTAVFLAGCFSSSSDSGVTPGAAGTITFDFVPTLVAGADTRLDYAHTVQLPARFVVVEAIDASTQDVYASTVTDANGKYSVVLPANVSVVIRARAQMSKAAGNLLDASVLDNTSGNASWSVTGPAFMTTQFGLQPQNLDAGSGWNGAAYVDAQRAAGPFAILDTLCTATQKVAAVDAAAVFPPLTVYWSPNNISAGSGDDAAEIALGQIGITHFSGPDTTTGAGYRLYVLGKADNDTDEYDRHVIAHEFGHYLQAAFSRDDSIGGDHASGDLLDQRVAFSEGWGDGWSGIALNDPIYTDTLGPAQATGSTFDVSAGAATNAGFFSEASVAKFFWDFNSAPSIGFSGLWIAMKSGLTLTPAVSGIHSFSYALNAQVPAASAAIASILSLQAVVLPSDPYGTGEMFFGTPPVQDLAPSYGVYPAVGQDLPNVCENNTQAPATANGREINRAGEFRFLRVAALAAGSHVITVTKLSSDNPTTAPVVIVYDKTGDTAESDGKAVDTLALTQTLAGGDYVVALTDFQLKGAAAARSCFNVRID